MAIDDEKQMTNTLRHAAELIADHARARGLRIEQVDPVLCEDGRTVMFHVYTPDDCLTAIAELPFKLDDEDSFLIDEWRDALFAMLPAGVIAEGVLQ